jgi:hypothetical protein
VLISGESGVGKSVLLEEFAEELSEARWLWAGCDAAIEAERGDTPRELDR